MWGCHVPQYSMTGVVGWETSDPSTVLYCGLGLLAAVVAFKRPLKMEYSGDIKRYALYLLISEGFFPLTDFFLFFVCVRERECGQLFIILSNVQLDPKRGFYLKDVKRT